MTSLTMSGNGFTHCHHWLNSPWEMAIIVGIPPLSRRARLPAVVGLLFSGVVLGPHVLGFFGEHAPIADFFAELGKLLLMFFAGLEIDIEQFRREQNKSIIFGLFTTLIPLLLGTAAGLSFGYQPVAAIVLGSLLRVAYTARSSNHRFGLEERGSSPSQSRSAQRYSLTRFL